MLGCGNVFQMKDEYRLNISKIDEQHEKLFEIIERAYSLLESSESDNKYKDIKEIIIELREYAEIHFKDEEEYMSSINYVQLDQQKHEHAEYIKYVHNLELQVLARNEDEYIMQILDFLYDWLLNHIVKKDMLIKNEND